MRIVFHLHNNSYLSYFFLIEVMIGVIRLMIGVIELIIGLIFPFIEVMIGVIRLKIGVILLFVYVRISSCRDFNLEVRAFFIGVNGCWI